MSYTYKTCCVNSTAEKIDDMMETAREVTYRTIAKLVGVDELSEVFSCYQWGRGVGLRLKDDYHVSFYTAKFDGRRACVVEHSRIEYVFTK